MELYIHIPFCERKCLYCDFLSFSSDGDTRRQYVQKLLEEIRAAGEQLRKRVTSIFIGGGTPSILTPEQILSVMAELHRCFQVDGRAEITIEANPGTLDKRKLAMYLDAGINRLSLGLQSANDRELAVLGRIHTFSDFEESFYLARSAGFSNINLDLMAALPGQTFSSYETTLKRAAGFSPEHISAYSLIIEEGTPFYERYARMEAEIERYGEPASKREGETLPPLPGEEADRWMYHFTRQFLEENGFYRYEISNYAKKGRECAHNTGYWTGEEYLGLGLGAASCLNRARFYNERRLKTYLGFSASDFTAGKHRLEQHKLSQKEQMEEFMFLGLRLTRGVSEEDFLGRFGISLESVYKGALEQCENEELMERYQDPNQMHFWRLTVYGMDVSNFVLSRFLLD